MKNLNKLFYASLLFTVIGIVLELVGGLLLSPPVDIGINTNLSPVLIIGMILVVLSFVVLIAAGIMSKKMECSEVLLEITRMVVIIGLIAGIIILVAVIAWPAAFPSNG